MEQGMEKLGEPFGRDPQRNKRQKKKKNDKEGGILTIHPATFCRICAVEVDTSITFMTEISRKVATPSAPPAIVCEVEIERLSSLCGKVVMEREITGKGEDVYLISLIKGFLDVSQCPAKVLHGGKKPRKSQKIKRGSATDA
jgi:hypothetical protein